MNEVWIQLVQRASRALDSVQIEQLRRFLDVLLDANTHLNLTRITDRAQAELLHIADSLTLLPHVPQTSLLIVDVGSGGGVPGIPLAIVRPDCRVTLIESTKKKAAFLVEAMRSLGLENVTVLAERAEDVARGKMRESFDVAVARALAPMEQLAEWCLPLVKVGGRVLAMKGAKAAEELDAAARAIRLLGGGKAVIHPAQLPGAERHVIVEIRKLAACDRKYPRPPTEAGRPI